MNERIDMDDMLEYATTALYTRIVEQKDSIIKNQRIALQQKDAEIDRLKKELEMISELNT